MKLSVKTSIIISSISIMIWVALFIMFFLSPYDYGAYADVSFGRVRGESVGRFILPSDDILLASKQGAGGYKDDMLIISKGADFDDFDLRIVRDGILLFEQKISYEYDNVEWDNENALFVVSSDKGSFWLIPAKNEYLLAPLE